MKWKIMSLAGCIAVAVTAAEEPVQPGTAAVIEAANGKKAPVFLQQLEGDRLTFQPYKVPRNRTVPVEAVKSLAFYPPEYDAEAVQQLVDRAAYEEVLSVLVPLMEPYEEYMAIENNLRELYSIMMESHFQTGDFENARREAAVMIATGEPLLVQRGQVHYALIALTQGDVETAMKLRDEIEGEAAGLYVQACIERENEKIKDAFKTISNILLYHGNDVEWMGRSELLSAHLYMDYMATNSVITTNSPMLTARQTMIIYRGTSVSAEAEKLWKSLGGEEAQAAIEAEKEEKRRLEAERKAERRAERARQRSAQETEPAAQTDADAGTNVTENVQSEDGQPADGQPEDGQPGDDPAGDVQPEDEGESM
jgi:hypothetical protein